MSRIEKNDSCRACKNRDLVKFLSLGSMPLANSFLKEEELDKEENVYPLEVYFCTRCGLAQLVDIVPPEVMFKDYIYVSSTSDTLPKHFMDLAREAVKESSNDVSLVIDIGSNDGLLLSCFQKLGTKVLGIDPAENVAKIANEKGIKTLTYFFDEETAKYIEKKYGKAKIITATNVLGHVNNLESFVKGVKTLIEENGIFVIEVPYVVDLIENIEFDTIYHEHLSYFSVHSAIKLFDIFGMEVFHVRHVSIHGGSIRIFVRGKTGRTKESVSSFLSIEKEKSFDTLRPYKDFSNRVEKIKRDTLDLLEKLKMDGKSIVGYGAPAKGNTLLNYFGIGKETINYTVDKSPLKQGLYTPGMKIPVYNPSKLLDDMPDYVFILAWNFSEEVIKQQKEYSERGGKFIVPIPKPSIF